MVVPQTWLQRRLLWVQLLRVRVPIVEQQQQQLPPVTLRAFVRCECVGQKCVGVVHTFPSSCCRPLS